MLLSDEDTLWIVRSSSPSNEEQVLITSLDGKQTIRRDAQHAVIKHEVVITGIQKKESVMLSKLQPGDTFCLESNEQDTVYMVFKNIEAPKPKRIDMLTFCTSKGEILELSKKERDDDLVVLRCELDIEIKDAFEKK